MFAVSSEGLAQIDILVVCLFHRVQEPDSFPAIQELVVGDRFPIQEILLSDATKKLVFRLPDNVSR